MATEICIHTPQGMVCYRNQALATAQGVDVDWDILYKDPKGGNEEPWNSTKLHDHIDEDTGIARLDLLFRRAKKDFAHKLAAHHIDLDEWFMITRR